MVRPVLDRADRSACCFDDVPYTDGTFCSGDEPHFFCLNCSGKYAKEEIAKSKYYPFLLSPVTKDLHSVVSMAPAAKLHSQIKK